MHGCSDPGVGGGPRCGVSGDAQDLNEVQDWIQCDTCDKWRKVGRGVILKEGDPWFCSLNTWKPKMAFCTIDQESDEDYDNDEEDEEEEEEEGSC